MWDTFECGGSWMPFGWVWVAIFWVAIIGLGFWLIRTLISRDNSDGGYYAAEIAKQRYARGKISREEFEQIKRDLK